MNKVNKVLHFKICEDLYSPVPGKLFLFLGFILFAPFPFIAGFFTGDIVLIPSIFLLYFSFGTGFIFPTLAFAMLLALLFQFYLAYFIVSVFYEIVISKLITKHNNRNIVVFLLVVLLAILSFLPIYSSIGPYEKENNATNLLGVFRKTN